MNSVKRATETHAYASEPQVGPRAEHQQSSDSQQQLHPQVRALLPPSQLSSIQVSQWLHGIQDYRQGNYQKSCEMLEPFALMFPHHQGLYSLLGKSYFHQQEFAKSARYLSLSLQHHPNDFESIYHFSYSLYRLREYDNALACLAFGLSKYPHQLLLLQLASTCYLNQYRLDEALTMIQKALHLNPNHPESCFRMGQVQEYTGNMKQAADWYYKALSSAPTHAGYFNRWLATQSYLHPEIVLSSYQKIGEQSKQANNQENGVDSSWNDSDGDVSSQMVVDIPLSTLLRQHETPTEKFYRSFWPTTQDE